MIIKPNMIVEIFVNHCIKISIELYIKYIPCKIFEKMTNKEISLVPGEEEKNGNRQFCFAKQKHNMQ